MIILASATFILFFIIAAKRPILALSALAALLPAYLLRFTVFGLPSTILEFIIWGAFLGTLLWKRRAGVDLIQLKTRLQKIKYPLFLFFLASIISIFIAPDLFSAIGKWRAFFLEPALIFLMILATVKNREDFSKIVLGLSISAFYLSVISIGQKFFGLPNPFLENTARAASVFPQPNMLGLYLGPIIILMLGQMAQIKKSLTTYYLLLTTALSLIAIVLAQSGGAIVGVAGGLVIFMLLWNKKTRLFLIVSALLLTTCYLLLPNNTLFLAAKNKVLFGAWSGVVRIQIWKESWAMLKDNWLWGAGVGGYPIKILPYHASRDWMEVYPMPHNIIFNFWSEMGLLGLAAFLWLLEKFGLLCYTRGNSSPFEKGGRRGIFKGDQFISVSPPLWKRGVRGDLFIITAISAMSVIIIHGLVDVPILKNDLSILFWIIYSIPFICHSRTPSTGHKLRRESRR